MFKKIIDFFSKKNCKRTNIIESYISDEKKRKIDKIWNSLDKMSGYGITVIMDNTQRNDLAIALAHSTEFIIKRFMGYLEMDNRTSTIKLIKKYTTITNKDDGYRMKSHIINHFKELFKKEKLFEDI